MKPFALFFILFVAISSTRLLFDGSPIKFSFKKIIMSVIFNLKLKYRTNNLKILFIHFLITL